LPVIRWPASVITDWFPFDAAKYHFPKAIEMYRTASAWDFSLAYAQYPYGYESILGFGLSLTDNELLFGLMHAIIDGFLLMTIWFLARRYTRLAPAPLFFLSVFILISELLPIPYNIWWVLRMMAQTIGKNDLLVGAAMLASVFHAPVGPRPNQSQQHLIGIGLSSMIAVSVKPNALIVIAPLWLLSLYRIIKENNQQDENNGYARIKQFILAAMLVLPGGLWALRNLLEQGVLFTEPIKNIQGWSIANNLSNPYLYNYIPKHLLIITVLLVISILFSLFINKPTRSMSLAFLLLFLSFIMSPVSAFFLNTDVPANVAWRFAVGVLLYCFVVLLAYLDRFITTVYEWLSRGFVRSFLTGTIILLASIVLIWQNQSLLESQPENAYILRDYYKEPHGTQGYNSVYDYVRQNIQHATIWEEGGLPYYLFGEDYTNSVSRESSPDYMVVFRIVLDDGVVANYPDNINDSGWQAQWSLIYEDNISRLYEHK